MSRSKPLPASSQNPTQIPTLDLLLEEIRQCRLCEEHLPLGPRPVLSASSSARILIVGQAPGTRVHETGIPWNDPSGDRLREWLGIDKSIFYDNSKIAIIPMGFCYPGKGKSGDLPPRKECAAQWQTPLRSKLPNIKMTLLLGQYALRHYLADSNKATLTETVKAWHDYAPSYFPLPHPSPRNNIWLKRNPWFEEKVVPGLREYFHQLI